MRIPSHEKSKAIPVRDEMGFCFTQHQTRHFIPCSESRTTTAVVGVARDFLSQLLVELAFDRPDTRRRLTYANLRKPIHLILGSKDVVHASTNGNTSEKWSRNTIKFLGANIIPAVNTGGRRGSRHQKLLKRGSGVLRDLGNPRSSEINPHVRILIIYKFR